mmetsp:Transcript_73013/g.171172  ORF Transcript_73013/g.171172 Transcript_73013/m.171172 type:complete len:403 (+) Transcript_73013:437-1645(+)
MLGYMATVAITTLPQLISPCSLDLWYFVLHGICTLPMFCECEDQLQRISTVSLIFRFLLGICARRSWLVILTGVLHWLIVVQRVNFSLQSDIFLQQSLEATLWLTVVTGVRMHMYDYSRLRLDLKSANVELGASAALLRGLCDTVVEVDSELKLVEKSKKCGSLPYQPFVEDKEEKDDLLKFFSKEDKEYIASALKQTVDGLSHPLALNARMLDDFGHLLDVELLHVPFVGPSGKKGRLIGIRDFRSAENAEVDQESSVDANLERVVTQDMSLLFDATSFEILAASEEFVDFLGSESQGVNLQNMTLTELFPDPRPFALCGRIQDAVNLAVHGWPEDFCCYNVELASDAVHVMVSLEHDGVLDRLVGTLSIAATSASSQLTEGNLARLASPAKAPPRAAIEI